MRFWNMYPLYSLLFYVLKHIFRCIFVLYQTSGVSTMIVSDSEVSPRHMDKQFNVHPHPPPRSSRTAGQSSAPNNRIRGAESSSRGTEGLDKETGGPTAFESDGSETSSVSKYSVTSAFSSQSEHPRGSRTLK